ncbi:MAG: alpha-amylase [Chloroflexota bacterium]|nr:MAG: alpha-amylase [Chloroflexota bacterium]
MSVPYWVQDAVFYQIFPDRFNNGDVLNDPANVQHWGTPPSVTGFQGGDLRGIIQKLDYLLDLGVTALYLNPIFLATSNHRYNTTDYLRIDPKLGDQRDLSTLLDAAHRNNLRVLLDGVFNHCGRGFFAFNDVLENQDKSPYRDWFHINKFPVDAYSPGPAVDYIGWWKHKSLPKFNTNSPAVRRFLLEVARYWVQLGIDGWRLDVPNEIDDDSFWAEFRYTVKSTNPEAYLVGEIWEDLPRWVGDGHFDGLMNYPFRTAVIGYLTRALTASNFVAKIERLLRIYPRENVYAMYVPLGSHDTERIATMLGNDPAKIKMAFSLLFSYPGAPAIYYGDEVGLEGGKDPECRGAFPWEQSQWKQDLRMHIQKLAAFRKRFPALRRGSFQKILTDDARGISVFMRGLGEEKIVAVYNASATRRTLHLPTATIGWPDGRITRDLLSPGEYIVAGDVANISLEPWSGQWLV